jgi:predicted transposase YbfD/YdcC
MVERERSANSKEKSYYLTSLPNNAALIAPSARGHWGIGNSLHFAFREDVSRIRKDQAPAHFAILRHIALNLLRQENSARSIKTKRPRAGWDIEYLGLMLQGSDQ